MPQLFIGQNINLVVLAYFAIKISQYDVTYMILQILWGEKFRRISLYLTLV